MKSGTSQRKVFWVGVILIKIKVKGLSWGEGKVGVMLVRGNVNGVKSGGCMEVGMKVT